MLINKTGAEFQYNGMAFKIGERIIANSQSEYSGLIGHILEIRDGCLLYTSPSPRDTR